MYDRKPYTSFYARASYRAIPLGNYDEILDEIVAKGGDYLVVGEAVVDFFRPSLLPLCTDKPVAWYETRLRPVYLNAEYEDRTTLIYRIVRPGGPPPLAVEADRKTMRASLAALHHQPNHFFHGVLLMRAESWQSAAGEFQYVINADSTNSAAYNNRAWSLLQANRALDSAESDARKAVSLEPDNPDYLDTLVEVLKATGKETEAARHRARLDSMKTPSPAGGDSRNEP